MRGGRRLVLALPLSATPLPCPLPRGTGKLWNAQMEYMLSLKTYDMAAHIVSLKVRGGGASASSVC